MWGFRVNGASQACNEDIRLSFRVRIISLSLGGTTISVPESGVVVLVGPNNSGKSLSLRELQTQLTQGLSNPLTVGSVQVEKTGSQDELAGVERT